MKEKNLPIIGLPCRSLPAERIEFRPFHASRDSYVNSIVAMGGAPLLIPLTEDMSVTRSLYNLCDGIFFCGGGDVCPSEYGEVPLKTSWAINPRQDKVELALFRWAFADKKPLLGACRGCQIMNIGLGGTLHQDIPSTFRVNHNILKNEAHSLELLVHSISIKPGSLLHSLIGTETVSVNSNHHQALKDVAHPLQVVASSPEGVIEAVEASPPDYDGFMIGLQCHPETLWQKSEPRWRRVFEAFISACNTDKKAKKSSFSTRKVTKDKQAA